MQVQVLTDLQQPAVRHECIGLFGHFSSFPMLHSVAQYFLVVAGTRSPALPVFLWALPLHFSFTAALDGIKAIGLCTGIKTVSKFGMFYERAIVGAGSNNRGTCTEKRKFARTQPRNYNQHRSLPPTLAVIPSTTSILLSLIAVLSSFPSVSQRVFM